MAETQETVADIVAEMRKRMKSYYYSREGRNLMWQYSDRIEAAWKRERKACKEAVLDFCNVFTLVYPPNDGDCPAVLAGAFELLKDAIGIETIDVGKGGNNGSK